MSRTSTKLRWPLAVLLLFGVVAGGGGAGRRPRGPGQRRPRRSRGADPARWHRRHNRRIDAGER